MARNTGRGSRAARDSLTHGKFLAAKEEGGSFRKLPRRRFRDPDWIGPVVTYFVSVLVIVGVIIWAASDSVH